LDLLLALSHIGVVFIARIEKEVVMLIEREIAKRAALRGAQLWGHLAYSSR
jgi:hypothetical protein